MKWNITVTVHQGGGGGGLVAQHFLEYLGMLNMNIRKNRWIMRAFWNAQIDVQFGRLYKTSLTPTKSFWFKVFTQLHNDCGVPCDLIWILETRQWSPTLQTRHNLDVMALKLLHMDPFRITDQTRSHHLTLTDFVPSANMEEWSTLQPAIRGW